MWTKFGIQMQAHADDEANLKIETITILDVLVERMVYVIRCLPVLIVFET